ncbi:hypothetical protein, partial [Natrinema limicola]|uniref:hypothetical protein n=1 Tax=Natrinema limicola TaxID=370323 RepID=UPI0019D39DB3
FTQVSHNFLLSASHYTKEILLLNNFPESLRSRAGRKNLDQKEPLAHSVRSRYNTLNRTDTATPD